MVQAYLGPAKAAGLRSILNAAYVGYNFSDQRAGEMLRRKHLGSRRPKKSVHRILKTIMLLFSQ